MSNPKFAFLEMSPSKFNVSPPAVISLRTRALDEIVKFEEAEYTSNTSPSIFTSSAHTNNEELIYALDLMFTVLAHTNTFPRILLSIVTSFANTKTLPLTV